MSNRSLFFAFVAAAAAVIVIAVIILTGFRDSGPGRAGTSGTDMPEAEPCLPALIEVGEPNNEALEALMRQTAEQEKITLHITEPLPAEAVLAEYDDGTGARRFAPAGSPTQLELMGPNKLGGELAVYTSPNLTLWCYVKHLAKRDVDIPADADLVLTEQNLVKAALSFSDEDINLLRQWAGVEFYESADSRLPLFTAGLRPATAPQTDYNDVPVRIAPGRYHMRAIITDGGQESRVPLGMIEITAEQSRTYPVYVPYK
jgi:hypothetical protein